MKLSKIAVEGSGKLSAAFAQWRTWIEWACNPIGSGAVRVSRSAAGPVIHVDMPSGPLFFKNTGGQITTGSSGTVTVYNDDGTTLSSRTETAWLFLAGPLALNAKGYMVKVGTKLHVVQGDCP